jgi:hypothetical protein
MSSWLSCRSYNPCLAFCLGRLHKDFGLRLTPRIKLVPTFDELTFSRVSLKQLLWSKTFLVLRLTFVAEWTAPSSLSEELEEDAVQTSIPAALDDLFPEPCEKLRITNEAIRVKYRQEFTKRKDTVCQELAKEEDSLRRGLRDAVFEDVKKPLWYVDRPCRRRLNDSVLAHKVHTITRLSAGKGRLGRRYSLCFFKTSTRRRLAPRFVGFFVFVKIEI